MTISGWLSIGNVYNHICKASLPPFAVPKSAGSSSRRPASRDTSDSGMSAPSHSNEILSFQQPMRAEVISLCDDEDGIDAAPVPNQSSRHALSKQVESPRPQPSARKHTKRDAAQSPITRSRAQANKAIGSGCYDVDDQGDADPLDTPGPTGKTRASANQRLSLAPTASTPASHEIFNDGSQSFVRSCTPTIGPQRPATSRRQTVGGLDRSLTPQGVMISERSRRTTEHRPTECAPLFDYQPVEAVPLHREFQSGAENHDDIDSSDEDVSESPPIKRRRKRKDAGTLSLKHSAHAVINSQSHSDEHEIMYNRSSTRRDRARREGSISDVDNNNVCHARDKGVPSIDAPYVRLDPGTSSDAARAATAAVKLAGVQHTPRRSQRVKNAPQILKEQRDFDHEVAQELVELDSFTINKHYVGPTDAIFVFPPGKRGSITVTVEERERLKRRLYLNDSLIDFYIKYLQTRLQAQARSPENIPFFYSSFFFKRMIQKRPIDYNGVKSWTKDTDIFMRKYVFVPICDSSHWSLIIVINLHSFEDLLANGSDSMDADKKPKIIYMDSLDPERGSEFGNKIIHYLSKEYYHRKSGDEESASELAAQRYKKISKLVRVLKPRVPVQSNEYDCGLYLLQCLKLFISDGYFQRKVIDEENDLQTSFSHTDVEQLRKDICDLMDRLEQNWQRKLFEAVRCTKTTEAKDSGIDQEGFEIANSVEDIPLGSSEANSGAEMDQESYARNSGTSTAVHQIGINETEGVGTHRKVRLDVSESDSVKLSRIAKESESIKETERMVIVKDDPDLHMFSRAEAISSDQSSKADELLQSSHAGLESNNGDLGNIDPAAAVPDAVVDLSEESTSQNGDDVKTLEEDEDVAEAAGNDVLQIRVFTQPVNSCASEDTAELADDAVLVVESGTHLGEHEEGAKAMVLESDSEIGQEPQHTREGSSETLDLVEDHVSHAIEVTPITIVGLTSSAAAEVAKKGADDGDEPGCQEARGMQNGKSLEAETGSFDDLRITMDPVHSHREQSAACGVEIMEAPLDSSDSTPSQNRAWSSESIRQQTTNVAPGPACNIASTGNADTEVTPNQTGTNTNHYGGKRTRKKAKKGGCRRPSDSRETVPDTNMSNIDDVVLLNANHPD